jgi:hypothetical protein
MTRPSLWMSAATLALLAACASNPAPAPGPLPARPMPRPPSPPPPSPPPPAEWGLLHLSPGGWVYNPDASGPQALFGPANGEASFIVRCDRARRQVVLEREGNANQLTLRTSSSTRTLAATPRSEPLAYLGAALPASDPLLDAMVFSRGRFTVEAPGLPMLVIPAWPEPARVIEDCRS